jgi:hypothetical protein
VPDAYSRDHKRCAGQTRSRLLCEESYCHGQDIALLCYRGLTDSGIIERPKSSVSIPTATRLSLILQRCAIRKRSCLEKCGQSVGDSFRRDSVSWSTETSASLSERACKTRAICGEDSAGEVCEEDAAPRKSQRICRRVQLILCMRLSICEEDCGCCLMTHTIAVWIHHI